MSNILDYNKIKRLCEENLILLHAEEDLNPSIYESLPDNLKKIIDNIYELNKIIQ